MRSAPADARPTPWSAIVATILAITAINVPVAYLIAQAAGARSLGVPLAGVWALLALGVLAAVAAIYLWRRYLAH
jgi:membrane protein implicated in regulation of membrane protease activity